MENKNQFRHLCVRAVVFAAVVMLSCGTAMAQNTQIQRQRKPTSQVVKPQTQKSPQQKSATAAKVMQTENAQRQEKSNKVYDAVEVPPSFPGGSGAMLSWIHDHIKYPPIAMKNDISGRVVVQLIVEKDGSVSNVNVVRSIDPSLDREAVRVVSSMPKWTPGKVKGSPVRVRYTLPVAFKLQQ